MKIYTYQVGQHLDECAEYFVKSWTEIGFEPIILRNASDHPLYEDFKKKVESFNNSPPAREHQWASFQRWLAWDLVREEQMLVCDIDIIPFCPVEVPTGLVICTWEGFGLLSCSAQDIEFLLKTFFNWPTDKFWTYKEYTLISDMYIINTLGLPRTPIVSDIRHPITNVVHFWSYYKQLIPAWWKLYKSCGLTPNSLFEHGLELTGHGSC